MDPDGPDLSNTDRERPGAARIITYIGSQFEPCGQPSPAKVQENGDLESLLREDWDVLESPQDGIRFESSEEPRGWLHVYYDERPERLLEPQTLHNTPGTALPSLVGEAESTVSSDRQPSLVPFAGPAALAGQTGPHMPWSHQVVRTTTGLESADLPHVKTAAALLSDVSCPSVVTGDSSKSSNGESEPADMSIDPAFQKLRLGSRSSSPLNPPVPERPDAGIIGVSPSRPRLRRLLRTASVLFLDSLRTATPLGGPLPIHLAIPRLPPGHYGLNALRLPADTEADFGNGNQGPGNRNEEAREGHSDTNSTTERNPLPTEPDRPARKRKRSMTEPTSHRRRGSHKEDNRGDDDDLSDSDRGGRPPRSPTPARRSTPRPCFACPFLKHDPVKYRSCHNKQLTKISYVKQHIKRSHRQPTHCPRCMTELADLEALGDHLREQTCTVVPARRFDGASQRQLGQLSRRSDQRKEEVAQWFDIYEILFPGEPRPKSAYLGSDLCDDLIDFMLGAGSASLTAVISEKIPGGNKEVVGAAVGEGLRRMFQDWQGNSSNSNNNNRLGLLLGGETETASPTQVTEGPHDEGE